MKTMVSKNIKFIFDIDEDNLKGELLTSLIDKHKNIVNGRFKVLQNYFEGKHNILNRKIDNGKPNNKNIFNYCRYITDQLTGYFIGKPVSYSSENKELLDKLNLNYKINNEELENNNLAHKSSVKGTSYELCYISETTEFKFKALDTDSVFFILDSSIENKLNYAIRYYDVESVVNNEATTYIEIYTIDKIIKYRVDAEGITLVSAEEHYFGEVPIIEYANNRYRSGDFEFIIDVQDSINKLKNDVANDLDYYSNCILALEGVDATDDAAMKKLESGESRTMMLPEGAKAGFITKNINNNVVEYYSNNLREDLHLLASIPDLTKLNITGDMKATAIKSLFFGTEQVVAEKERQFKLGLEKRIRLYCKFLEIKSNSMADWRDIEITFNRNIPVNLAEFGDSVIKLQGTLPKEMVLEELKKAGLDIDVNRALALLKNEQETYTFDNSIPTLEGVLNEQ